MFGVGKKCWLVFICCIRRRVEVDIDCFFIIYGFWDFKEEGEIFDDLCLFWEDDVIFGMVVVLDFWLWGLRFELLKLDRKKK